MKISINFFAILITVHMCSSAMEIKPPLNQQEARQRYSEALHLISEDKDLTQAEALLLSVKDQVPEAYLTLMDVAHKQDDAERSPKSSEKLLRYAQDAVSQGFNQCLGGVGFGYELMKDYAKAREYYQKGLLHAPQHPYIYANLARLLINGLGGPADAPLGVKYLKLALNAGNKDAVYYVAQVYGMGFHTPQNPQEAYRLYSQIIADPSNAYYPQACNDVGILYEWGLLKPAKGSTNIQEALKYFTMAKNTPGNDNKNKTAIVRAKAHIARLVWTGKTGSTDQNEREQARKDLELCAAQGDDIAIYLCSAILINQGDIDQAIDLLLGFYAQGNKVIPTLVKLQLAIAHQDGWIDSTDNTAKAEQLFNAIMAYSDTTFRSTFLARAYMYIMGIGIEKNEQLGFSLLEESNKKNDDVFLDTYALFPELKAIKENFYRKKEELVLQLIAEEEAAKTKKQKGKQKAAPSISVPSTQKQEAHEIKESETQSAPALIPRQKENILNLPVTQWNNYWQPNDGSAILHVTRSASSKKTTITITDPSRDEELIVLVDQKPYLHFSEVKDLIYDPRVQKREAEDLDQGKRNHVFARMLDYVIQCAGKLSLFAKDGSDQPKDQIIAMVTRVNKTTKREILCKAEYTFYKDKSGKDHLYHRLLRPIQ